jgi:hypothetical protein
MVPKLSILAAVLYLISTYRTHARWFLSVPSSRFNQLVIFNNCTTYKDYETTC